MLSIEECLGRGVISRVLNRADDVLVTSAAADVAFKRVADFVLRWVRIALKERGGRHNHAGGAESTLKTVLFPKSFLDRVQIGFRAETLNRDDFATIGLNRKHRAAFDRRAVQMNDTGAARTRVAADVRSGQSEILAQEMDKQRSRFNRGGMQLAVDGHQNRNRGRGGHWISHCFTVSFFRLFRANAAAAIDTCPGENPRCAAGSAMEAAVATKILSAN
jgi:hypothetical protein